MTATTAGSPLARSALHRSPLPRSFRLLCLASGLSMAFAAAAAPPLLPIKAGFHVQEDLACSGAPNAALLEYDGKGLTGAHSQDSKTSLASRKGRDYRLRVRCPAQQLGPNPAKPYDAVQRVKVLSDQRFSVAPARGTARLTAGARR